MTHSTSEAAKDNWQGPLILLLGGICIGFAPILLRIGVGEGGSNNLGPQAVAFWRFIFAIPILLGINFVINRRFLSRPNRHAILAGVFFAINIGLWHWGLTITTVANATFIVGLGNMLAGVTAWIIIKERPTNMWALAVSIAILGAALLSLGGGSDETAKSDVRGDALALAAAVMVSCYVVFGKLARQKLSAIDVITWATITEAGVSALLVGLSNVIPVMPTEALWPATMQALVVPALLAIVVQTMGQGLIILGLGKTSAAVAGVMIVVQPVTAAAIAWVLFKEPLVGFQVLGAGLILLGVFIAAKYGARASISNSDS